MQNAECKINETLFYSLILVILLCCSTPLYAFTDADIAIYQQKISNKPVGDRIAFWAEKFVGIPYDTDPLGEYVTRKVIVADDRVDCMYLSFRSVELALGLTSAKAVSIALDKRFINKGIVKDGVVVNYDDRFEYGEDMIDSGKWGEEITGKIGAMSYIKGSRGRDRVGMVSKSVLISMLRKESKFKSGDFIFFVKSPDKRAVGEVVGHIGVIKVESNKVFLIHAGGVKNKGGEVKKILFSDYLNSMPFIGVRVTRF